MANTRVPEGLTILATSETIKLRETIVPQKYILREVISTEVTVAMFNDKRIDVVDEEIISEKDEEEVENEDDRSSDNQLTEELVNEENGKNSPPVQQPNLQKIRDLSNDSSIRRGFKTILKNIVRDIFMYGQLTGKSSVTALDVMNALERQANIYHKASK